jgi:SAM-dependent methyltransferase
VNAPPEQEPGFGPLVADELQCMAECLDLSRIQVLELGCGKARQARQLLQRFGQARVIGIEPHADLVQGHAQRPQAGLVVLQGRAEAVPSADAAFDMVWMLKSLHHIPDMPQALKEAARVLRPGGWLYVSEPVYAGRLNAIVRLYNDEGSVRAAAQQALDVAADSPLWGERREWRFVQNVHFADAQDFENRMMQDALSKLPDAPARERLRRQVAAAYAPHQTADGAHFVRPMHARALQRAHARVP